jgi:hypothetical protein
MADTDFDALEKVANEAQDFWCKHVGTGGIQCGEPFPDHFNGKITDHEFYPIDPDTRAQLDNLPSFGESKATEARWECLDCDSKFDDAGKHQEETGHHNIAKYKGEEAKATEDGMYANFGDKDKDNSWRVMTVASDLLYFNSEQEAEDYVRNFPEGTYEIRPPRIGEASFGDYDVDCDCDKDPDCKTCGGKGTIAWHSTVGESRREDLKREIKKQEQFINLASIENPMNIYDEKVKLEDMKNELASLGEGHHIDLEDTTKYIDDPEEDKEESEEFDPDEDWWGTPEDVEREIHDLKNPEEKEEAEEYTLDPETTPITTCVFCGRDIDSHSNPNTDYRGMKGDAPPTDHYFSGGKVGDSDDGYDFY